MKYFVVRETGSYINNKNDLGGDWNMYIYIMINLLKNKENR